MLPVWADLFSPSAANLFQSLDSYLKGAKLRFKELFDSYDRTRKGYLSITVSRGHVCASSLSLHQCQSLCPRCLIILVPPSLCPLVRSCAHSLRSCCPQW